MYIALGNYGSRSVIAKQALYAYIATLRDRAADMAQQCRADGDLTERGKPTSHLHLLHQIQSLDAEDPWLQVRGEEDRDAED